MGMNGLAKDRFNYDDESRWSKDLGVGADK